MRSDRDHRRSSADDAWQIADVEQAIRAVMQQNRSTLIQTGTGWKQVSGTYQGQQFVLGVNNGHVGQFYPVL